MSLNVVPELEPQSFDADVLALPAMRDGEPYAIAGLTALKSGGWLALCSPAEPVDATGVRSDLGHPGLWRSHVDASRLTRRRAFEIPVHVLEQAVCLHSDDAVLDGAQHDAAQRLLEWAVATEGGHLRRPWSPPARDELESWFAPERLTFQSASILRQGSLIHEPGCLALRFPIVPAPPNELPASRRTWMQELLVDAQNQTRMVRIGTTNDGAVQTELDLTGAPHALLEPLLRVGLDALRWVVEWIARTAELLYDVRAQCRTLDLCSPRAQPAHHGGKKPC